jgi:organic radical activating enzyme
MDIQTWIKRCDSLSRRVVKEKGNSRKYLLANFSGTAQKKDIEVHTSTMGNDFYRTKDNLKVNSDNEAELEVAVKSQFDMPDWASRKLGLSLASTNLAFMPQLKACNVHCPWCFVDDQNKNGEKETGEYFSISEVVDAFQSARKESGKPLHLMRLSGGEPTLAPWQWLELLQELNSRGLSKGVYFQGETNLTTGHFIEYLQKENRLDRDFLKRVSEYNNFGVLCSFKGTDTESFLRAIGFCKKDGTSDKRFSFLEEERWYSFDKMVRAGIDCYPFVYDPNPQTIRSFLEKGFREYGENFVSKTWVFPLKLYGPEKERLTKKGIDPELYQTQLSDNFKRSEELMYKLVPHYTGHEYKAIPRTGIILKARRR